MTALLPSSLILAASAQALPASTNPVVLHTSRLLDIENGSIVKPGIEGERIVEVAANTLGAACNNLGVGFTAEGDMRTEGAGSARTAVRNAIDEFTFDARATLPAAAAAASNHSWGAGPPYDSLTATKRATDKLSVKTSVAGPMAKKRGEDSIIQPSNERLRRTKPTDFNRNIYYKNKLEFSLDGGGLPINVPFPLDVFVGDVYNTYPLKYTLVPIIASLRWHMNDVAGPSFLRGNWDLTFSGSVTAVPRGPENRYFSYIMGIRRNFVPRNWRIVPYFDTRLGLGHIDAKGPRGVPYAQGQDFTFNMNMGSGVRYNFNSRYAISAGMHFMHISNLDLSEGNGKPDWGVRNYGINVYGPMIGIDIQLRRQHRHSEQ